MSKPQRWHSLTAQSHDVCFVNLESTIGIPKTGWSISILGRLTHLIRHIPYGVSDTRTHCDDNSLYFRLHVDRLSFCNPSWESASMEKTSRRLASSSYPHAALVFRNTKTIASNVSSTRKLRAHVLVAAFSLLRRILSHHGCIAGPSSNPLAVPLDGMLTPHQVS